MEIFESWGWGKFTRLTRIDRNAIMSRSGFGAGGFYGESLMEQWLEIV
jgi:hypothetical protein